MSTNNIHTREVVLCKEETDRVSVNVTAQIDDARLTICGIDYGKAVEECWGDDDYEYWYYFDEQNTEMLFQKIAADVNAPLTTLKEKFSGMDGCRKLREFCEAEGILFRFDSWT